MTTVTARIVVLLLAAAACSSAPPFDGRHAVGLPLAAPVSVPASFHAGVVFVPTRLDGRGPFQWVLDTGSTTSIVSERVADGTDLDVSRRSARVVTDAGTSEGVMRQAAVRDLRIGGVRFTGVEALVMDLAPMTRSAGRPVDGVAGTPLLRHHVWTIDASRRRVTAATGALDPAHPGAIPLTFTDGLPHLEVTVGGHTLRVLLDTGQGATLTLSDDDAARLRGAFDLVRETVGHAINGPVAHDVARLRGDLVVGPVVLTRPEILIGGVTRVGLGAFAGRSLTIDLARSRIAVGD